MYQYIDQSLFKKIAAVAVAVVVLIVILQVYRKIKYRVQQPPRIPVPNDNPFGAVTPGSYNPGPLTVKLYEDIRGWKFFNNYAPWKELSELSDTDVVKVMNEWDKRYFATWGETLLEAFAGETRYRVNTWFSTTHFLTILRARLERLEKLRK